MANAMDMECTFTPMAVSTMVSGCRIRCMVKERATTLVVIAIPVTERLAELMVVVCFSTLMEIVMMVSGKMGVCMAKGCIFTPTETATTASEKTTNDTVKVR